MIKKNKCFKKLLKNKSVSNKAKFNEARNIYNRILQKKQNYFRQTFKKLSNNFKET